MDVREAQTVVASTSKAIKKAKIIGKLDLSLVNLYSIFNYYIDFTQDTIDSGLELYVEDNQTLRDYRSKFKYINNKEICNYKITTDKFTPNTTNPIEELSNTAPTVSGIEIDLVDNASYVFKVSDFTTNFQDAEGDSYKNLILYLDDANGTFKYNGNIVSGTYELAVSNVANLVYTRPDNTVLSETLSFRIRDDNLNSLYSSLTSNNLVGDEVVINQPPTIGDNTIYADNRVITILTLDMFTSQLAPPYNDPEGDLIDAIRIDSIAESNLGIYYVNDIEVSAGTIITREELIAEAFTHVGADIDTVSSDTFIFSARDEGSQIWVD